MARGGAGILDGSIYHLISRFVAKEWFIDSARERRMYLALLGTAIAATDWRLFSYAVMSSHIHLGVLAGSVALRDWMRPMHTTFANWMNEQRERIGAVFVRGPNVIHVRAGDVGELVRYIHLNPVRAGVVASPVESDWTSHRAYEGAAYTQPWLDIQAGTQLAGFESPADLARWCSTPQQRNYSAAALLSPRAGRGRPRARCASEKAKPA